MTSVGETPTQVSALLEKGVALHNEGVLDRAEQLYRDVLHTDPSQPDALHLLGLIHHQSGDNQKAAHLIRQAIKRSQNNATYHSNLAVVCMSMMQYESAVEAAQNAVNLTPQSADALATLGTALQRAGRGPAAETVLRHALLTRPDHVESLTNLGTLLLAENNIDDAETFLRQAIGLSPQNVTALTGYGKTLLKGSRIEEAITYLTQAHDLEPFSNSVVSTLADALLQNDKPSDALKILEEALSRTPEDVNILNIMGYTLRDLDRQQEALKCFNKAISIAPDHVTAHVNTGLTMLANQQFGEAWTHYAYRAKQSDVLSQRPDLNIDPWTDQDLKNSRLVVWTEQGIGDEVLQASLISDLTCLVKELTVICSDRLASIFTQSFSGTRIIPRTLIEKGHLSIEADIACPLLDTGQVLRQSSSMFPSQESYLRADEKLVSELRGKYEDFAAGNSAPYIVALSWKSHHRLHGKRNTIPLKNWIPVLNMGSSNKRPIVFIASQYKASTDEISEANAAGAVLHIDSELDHGGSMDSVAAQLSACDLIISTSTTTAQLGAALGRPVLHLPATGLACGWYWLTKGKSTPWYPTMHQIRRTERESTTEQIDEAARVLSGLLGQTSMR